MAKGVHIQTPATPAVSADPVRSACDRHHRRPNARLVAEKALTKLGDAAPRYDLLDSYYTGDAMHPDQRQQSGPGRVPAADGVARTNFAELVVEAVRERMKPVAFRTGAQGDDNGDAEAWRIWQANSLDADSALVHRASLSMADAT
jgi:hypothetical protein